MSKWNVCCSNWFRNPTPKKPQEGQFKETQYCPTCKTPLDLFFECSYPDDSMTSKGCGEDASELKCKLVRIEDNAP